MLEQTLSADINCPKYSQYSLVDKSYEHYKTLFGILSASHFCSIGQKSHSLQCPSWDFNPRSQFIEDSRNHWSNSIYDRGCARAIPDHVMKVTDQESAKISNLIQSVTTVIDCFFDMCASPRFKSSTLKIPDRKLSSTIDDSLKLHSIRHLMHYHNRFSLIRKHYVVNRVIC